ncbi:dTDP-4-dehydrorhamnose 3,5-epimerase [Ruminococcaceae bacterium OttesenSCG-928-N02]|nr:dTDP-4-dehydrorhamnose 3,5-epimerase [Ruminococcaceae bacterium OttesenSCG-928-N02]
MGKFTFEQTGLAGCILVRPTVYGDARGYFMETYHEGEFKAAGIDATFVQDNQSKSSKGVLRGLHFQRTCPQGKLVRVVSGAVFDVAVDLRPASSTFGKWFGTELSADNKAQLYVPQGFAHGFLVLSDEAEFTYKCTDFYAPGDEGGLCYDDAQVGVQWPDIGMPYLLSEKDGKYPPLQEQNFDFFNRW